MSARLTVWLLVLIFAEVAYAQEAGSPEQMFAEAQGYLAPLTEPYNTQALEALQKARGRLDQIVADHPSSDLAVLIQLQDIIDGMDVAKLDKEIARLSALATVPSDTNAHTSPTFKSISPALSLQGMEQSAARETQSQTRQTPESCLRAIPAMGDGGTIVILMVVKPDGNLDDLPDMVLPETPNTNDRLLYFTVLQALEECTPFQTDGAASSYRVALGESGVQYVSEVPTESAYPETVTTSTEANPHTLNILADPPDWIEATVKTEAELDIKRSVFAEIQARLKTMGYDPKGIDGVAGKGTRQALSMWQDTQSIPATGYLDAPQLAALRAQSEAVFQDWTSNPKNKALLTPSPRSQQRTRGYRGSDGCLRSKRDNRRGSIFLGRSKYCNLRALGLK